MMKLWGGRFKGEKDPLMAEFDRSFPIDKRLWKEDIQGSIAHVRMLGRCEILSEQEMQQILSVLTEIAEEIESERLTLEGEFEDIHSFIEYQVVKRLGSVGKKIHTARSRNDQVATDMKLYVKAAVQTLLKDLSQLRNVLVEKAEVSCFPMPGYTHMQRAQIVTFKYHLLTYEQMLQRDEQRLKNAVKGMDSCPLGSGALAGSTYPIDRAYTAELLDFEKVQSHTMDSVSDRDYLIELISDFSILIMHLSRLAEELILYSTKEFDFIRLSDAYSTGSSLMPHKKNPDSLELIRGKTGRVYASLIGMLTVMKALPLCYNKDMQEDKAYFFESYDTVRSCVCIMQGVIQTMEVQQEAMKAATKGGFLNATEFADYLVRKGLAFRDAHQLTGKIVSFCEMKNCEIHQLSLEELKQFSDKIEEDVYTCIDLESILNRGNKRQML